MASVWGRGVYRFAAVVLALMLGAATPALAQGEASGVVTGVRSASPWPFGGSMYPPRAA